MLHGALRMIMMAASGPLAVALAGCATAGRTGQTPITGGKTAAMVATFRYMFTNNGSAFKNNVANFCIGTGSVPNLTNPNPEVVKALGDVRPKILPASACTVGARAVNAAGQPVLIFNIKTIRCDESENCLFKGGYYEGNMSASDGRYRARWIEGRWKVSPEGPQAIS